MELGGMDGNRTHPGRLSSAPQTVLRTAGLVSATVQRSTRVRQSLLTAGRLDTAGEDGAIDPYGHAAVRAHTADPEQGGMLRGPVLICGVAF